MAFCSKCGTQVADGVKFCPSCGNNVDGTTNTQQEGFTQTNNQANFNQGNFGQQGFNASGPSFMNTADTTSQYYPQDIANNKVLAILSYLGLLWLIPFFAGKASPFAKYHVKQGFLIVCAEFGWGILGTILRVAIRTRHDLGWGVYYYSTPGIVNVLVWLVHLAIWAFAILGIINAAQGKAKEVPVVGKFANKLTFLK